MAGADRSTDVKRAAPIETNRDDARGWWSRRPLLVAWLVGAGFLGLFQAAFLLWRGESWGGGLAMFFNLVRFGLLVGFATFLALLPAIFLLRRLDRRWRGEDRGDVSWSICFGLAAALVAWIVADRWAAGPWIPTALEPWFAFVWALAIGCAASWVRPPERWIRVGAVIALALLVFSFLPIGGPPEMPGGAADAADTVPPAAAAAAGERPDVVLVSVDTLRADRLRAYGGTASLTPEMDRFADEGVVFGRALAASPWTVPSVASMLTGLPTPRHGAGLALGSGPTYVRSPLDGELTTLAERFAAAGYRTRAVVANGFLSPWSGMAQGFQEFANPFTSAMFSGLMLDLPLTRLVVALAPPET